MNIYVALGIIFGGLGFLILMGRGADWDDDMDVME